jgi:hypothetical protein
LKELNRKARMMERIEFSPDGMGLRMVLEYVEYYRKGMWDWLESIERTAVCYGIDLDWLRETAEQIAPDIFDELDVAV